MRRKCSSTGIISKSYHNTPFLFQHDHSLKSSRPDDQIPSNYNHSLLPILGNNLVKEKLTVPRNSIVVSRKISRLELSFAKFDAIWKIIEGFREILATKSVKTFETWKQRTFYAIPYHRYEFHNLKSLKAITNVNSKIKRFLLSMTIVMFS